MIKVSVIILVQGADRLLKSCLESIAGQTLSEFEVLCIALEPAGNTSKIIEEYVAADSRFRDLYIKESVSAGVAYNKALKEAKGQYVFFLDTRCFFEPDAFKRMYEQCELNNADVCVCAVRGYDAATDKISYQDNYLNVAALPDSVSFSGRDMQKSSANFTNYAVLNKLFLRDFIMRERLTFQKELFASDIGFTRQALQKARSIAVTDRILINLCLLTDVKAQGKNQKPVNTKRYDYVVKTKTRSPRVSVIIPVYNMEDYVEETLLSVIQQTLHDIEIICVDDGSTDGSLAILERLAKEDCRIQIVQQKNAGLSCARNTGLSKAKGKYVHFLDSDDYLAWCALAQAYAYATEKDLEIAFFEGTSFYEPISLAKEHRFYINAYRYHEQYNSVYTGQELLTLLVRNHDVKPKVDLQLLSRSFLLDSKVKFFPGILHEDNLFLLQCLIHAKRVSVLHEPLFSRRIRNNSIMTVSKSWRNVYGYLTCMIESKNSLIDNDVSNTSFLRAAAKQLVRMGISMAAALHDLGKMEVSKQTASLAPEDRVEFVQLMEFYNEQKRLNDQIKEQKSKLVLNEERLKAQESRLKQSNDLCASQKEKMSVQREEISSKREQILSLQKYVKEQTDKLEKTRVLLEAQKVDLNEIRQLTREQVKQIGALEERSKICKEENLRQKNENESLVKRHEIQLNRKEKVIEIHVQKVRDLRDVIKDKTIKNTKLSREIVVFERRVEKLSSRNDELVKGKKTIKEQNDLLNSEIQELKTKLKQSEERFSVLKKTRAYRLGRFLTAPLRIIKRFLKSTKK